MNSRLRIVGAAAPWLLLGAVGWAALVSGQTTKLVNTPKPWFTVTVLPGTPQAQGWVAFFACAGGLSQDEGIVRETLRLNQVDGQPMWTAPITQPKTLILALKPGADTALKPEAEAVLAAVRAAPECEA